MRVAPASIRLLAAAVLVASAPAPRSLAGQRPASSFPAHPPVESRSTPVPQLPVHVVLTAQRGGTLVRRGDGVRVTRVAVPASPGAAVGNVPPFVWRVDVAGRYPPRALRYIVLAGNRPLGYGVPTADERAVRTVTADAAVLDRRVHVVYEGQATREPRPPSPPQPEAPPPPRDGDRLPNPAAPGPLPVERAVYDLGDEAFQPTGFRGKVELAADVHYPRGLPGGPYPLALFLHGNHTSCYRGERTAYTWPCKPGFRPLPNYRGYDYIARRLASYGYIVVSISGNGVNVLGSLQDRYTGMRQRGELIEKHIDLWHRWATSGGQPFGDRFIGKVDLSRIGTMGHSRGGEGAVWNVIVDRERPQPYGIDAVLALAPVDFTRTTVNNVPLSVILPYCDGDVFDLQGIHFFDDARYRVPGDPAPKETVTVMGANHNFFNTVWTPTSGIPGGFDDGTLHCVGRLTAAEERTVGASYVVGFFRRYVGGETRLDPMWTGAATPRPIPPSRTLVSYLAPDTPSQRLDVDRFTDAGDLSRDQLDAPVTSTAMSLYGWCADTFETPCVPGEFSFADVHLPGLSQGVLGWSNRRASVRFAIPSSSRDVHAYDALQFRAAVNPGYGANAGVPAQDLTVVLLDGRGRRAAVAASDVGNEALRFPPGLESFAGHVILNQVRFPLRRFHAVDLRTIRAVTLRFSRTRSGVIDVADLAFTRGARPPAAPSGA